jgi:protein TonB
MQFVVREDGKVDPASIKTLRATNPEFAEAARVAIRSARFIPAEIGGKKVAQVVQQPFAFELR